ncbi:helix-turn-helix transcriptional regulator [uncultured Paenibacillus sp.]|uniref:helix-turn-helix domain-containing protein n=1 Tax=uncultured Paenibacillus sp. TaxID=227322 RepID=UPI0015AA1689|nr:helix-turn-helix transcriptional regulator [uncultured Paenibacillus sp.]
MTRVKAELVVKNLLKERGLTQKELSKLTGMREATVSRLARGFVDRVELEQISKIANALNITDISEILKLVEDKEGV